MSSTYTSRRFFGADSRLRSWWPARGDGRAPGGLRLGPWLLVALTASVLVLTLLVLPLLGSPARADDGSGSGSPVDTQTGSPVDTQTGSPLDTQAATPWPSGESTAGLAVPGSSGTTSSEPPTSGAGFGVLAPTTGRDDPTSPSTTGTATGGPLSLARSTSGTSLTTTLSSGTASAGSADPGNITVRKHAGTLSGRLIDTATFQLWDDVNRNGVLDDGVTDSTSTSSSTATKTGLDTKVGGQVSTRNGTHTWTGLGAGRYLVEETSPPDGYSLSSPNFESVNLADNQTMTVDFADPKGSSTSTASTSTASTSTASTSVSESAAVTPTTESTGGGAGTGTGGLPGTGAPAYLGLVALLGLAAVVSGGWLIARSRRPRGRHAL